MLRYLLLAAAVCVFCRWVFGKWPWEYLRGSSARVQGLRRARQLLGVGPGASREEIVSAHRQLVGLVHPDRGGSKELMQEVNAARDLLLAQLPPATGGEGG